jgi:hypothetical protein
MQMPCCDLAYHPQCGISRLFSGGYYDTVICGCGTTLHASPYDTITGPSHSAEIQAGNALLETDAVKPDVKNLKEKIKAVGSASKEFDALVKEEFVAFEESVLPQLEAIKTLKENRIAAIRQTTVYKKFQKAKAAFTYAYSAFQKKHDIPTCCLRQKIGSSKLVWRLRYLTPLLILRRKFRLRKWLK